MLRAATTCALRQCRAVGWALVVQQQNPPIQSQAVLTRLLQARAATDDVAVLQAQRAQDDQQTEPLSSQGGHLNQSAQHKRNNVDDQLGESATVKDVFDIVQQQGPNFTDCNCVSALQRLAALNAADATKHPSFPALVDMIMAAAATFTPQEHTQLIAAAGALRVQDQDLLDCLARELMANMGKMDAAQVEQLATGLAQAGHSPSVALFDALRTRAQEVGVHGGQAEALRKAFGTFGYTFD